MHAIQLDVHTHLIPVEPEALSRFSAIEWDQGGKTMTIDGHLLGLKPLFQPEALIAWMDSNGIVRAWVSSPPPTYRMHLGDSEAQLWVAYLNQGLRNICGRHAARLAPLLHLPVEHPGLAAHIAADAIASGHRRFAMACGDAVNIVLSDHAYQPLWAVLSTARAFVLMHPPEGHDSRLDAFYLHNLLGNPYETALALSHLVLGGVLERYLGMQICLAHGGGLAPSVIGRLQRGFETARPGLDKALLPPGEAVRKLKVDCIVHDPKALELTASAFGETNIVFGSDWPFPMGLPEPHQQLSGVNAGLRSRILASNAD